jgi:hypothetical protein
MHPTPPPASFVQTFWRRAKPDRLGERVLIRQQKHARIFQQQRLVDDQRRQARSQEEADSHA